jgi:sporulation protein YlmC with PRC-barrel domain
VGDLHLVRDLLDMRVVDRNGRDMGRVDSIVLELRENGPPRVSAIEIGPSVLAYRVLPLFGRWAAALEDAFDVDEGRPVRIPFADILEIGDHVKVDRAFSETPAASVEKRLRRWIGRIPGAS